MLLYWHDDGQVPGDEEGNETPEQLRTYFTLNDNLKPVGVGRAYGYMDWTLMMRVLFETVTKAKRMTMIRKLIISLALVHNYPIAPYLHSRRECTFFMVVCLLA